MPKSQAKDKHLSKRVVNTLASIARGIAEDSVENHCYMFMHQPKEPKSLKERLEALHKGQS